MTSTASSPVLPAPAFAGAGSSGDGNDRARLATAALSGRSPTFPQATNRNRIEPLPEPHAEFSIIENHTTKELLSRSLGEFAQTAKISLRNGRRRLDFNSAKRFRISLQHDVHFKVVPIPKVREPSGRILPARLFSQFLEYERLQELPEQDAVSMNRLSAQAKYGSRKARVPNMQLWSLDETL